MKDIYVCAYADVKAMCKKHDIRHVISMIDPTMPDYPGTDRKWPVHIDSHLILRFHDITYEAPDAPQLEHMKTILTHFNLNIPDNSKVLFHCEAGISRSTAAAIMCYITDRIIADDWKNYENVEWKHNLIHEAFQHVKAQREMLYPNGRMMKFANDILFGGPIGGPDPIILDYLRQWEIEEFGYSGRYDKPVILG